jgi:hypothetical protein
LPDPDKHILPSWLRVNPWTKIFNPIIYRWPNRVQEIPAEMQEDPRAILALTRFTASKALLLVSYWTNTYDVSAIKIIWSEAKKQGILAYVVSPVNANPWLYTYISANEMMKVWIKPLYMTKETARAKIMLAFAKFKDNTDDITEFITTDFLWEIPNEETKRDD